MVPKKSKKPDNLRSLRIANASLAPTETKSETLAKVHAQLKAKWARSLAQMSVGADLPRFVVKIEVRRSEGKGEEKLVWRSPSKDTHVSTAAEVQTQVRTLLVGLAAELEVLGLERTYDEFFSKFTNDDEEEVCSLIRLLVRV